MTVKELKEKLTQFPEDCVVLIPSNNAFIYTRAENVSMGFNEMDGCVIIDEYAEEE